MCITPAIGDDLRSSSLIRLRERDCKSMTLAPVAHRCRYLANRDCTPPFSRAHGELMDRRLTLNEFYMIPSRSCPSKQNSDRCVVYALLSPRRRRRRCRSAVWPPTCIFPRLAFFRAFILRLRICIIAFRLSADTSIFITPLPTVVLISERNHFLLIVTLQFI